jgi:hypothetical protein
LKDAGVLKSMTDAHVLVSNLRPLQTAMVLRAPETTEFVTKALLAACRRVAESESIPKLDAALEVRHARMCIHAHTRVHTRTLHPRCRDNKPHPPPPHPLSPTPHPPTPTRIGQGQVGSKLLCWSAMESLHVQSEMPSSDAASVLLHDFYPALLVCVVDDLLREGEGECEVLEAALYAPVMRDEGCGMRGAGWGVRVWGLGLRAGSLGIGVGLLRI